jgi:glycosyltransferase involved in cell wall biosynthesis
MKVCVPFRAAASGGPSIFFKRFSQALARHQIEITNTWSNDCDVLLAIMSAPLKALLQARRRGVPVVQRLDGVYYPAVSGRRWWLNNLPIWITYRFFANWVVFQSEYSQRMCERFLGQPHCPTSVIYNGVDLNLFAPDGEGRKPAEGTVFLCLLATFWRQSEILPVIEAFDRLRMQYQDARLVVVGEFVPHVQHIPNSRPDILWMGRLSQHQLPVVYRGADLMLSAKLRAPCPNAVIEAMACGLPIACFESGAHRELVGDEGGICVPLNDNFGPFPYLNGAALADAGSRILQNRSKFASGARWRAEQHFRLDDMVERYLTVFKEVIGLRGH